jgi:hypothetical protein
MLASAAAHAQPVRVDAVQSPAWLERDSRAVPLAAGTALQPRDRLVTGPNGRVQLQLAEGSAVKLGANAQFVIDRAEDRGVFRAALDVVAGAFRFTTAALRGARERDVAIKVKNVSVGIRGTDVWGKATEERDFVVLIEGQATVASAGEPRVALSTPLQMYDKPRDQAARVVSIDRAQLDALAAETEIAHGGGARGEWRIVVARAAGRDAARELQRRLRVAGFPADIDTIDGALHVVVANLRSEAHAREVMGNMRGIPGVTLPKVAPIR